MKTIDKVRQCLNWMYEENFSASDPKGELIPKKTSKTQVVYYDIDDNKCVLNFVRDEIYFDNDIENVMSFEEFLVILTGNDEYLLEVMLNEIELD